MREGLTGRAATVVLIAAMAAVLMQPAPALAKVTPKTPSGAQLQRPSHGSQSSSRALSPRTITPGGTWAWQNPKPDGNPLFAISCPSATTCFAAGLGQPILMTSNGGSTWTQQAFANEINSISCADASHCVAAGDNGVTMHTSDAGTTWASVPANGGNFLAAVSCATASICVAVGYAGSVLTTGDGGASWTPESSGVANNLFGVSCPSTSICFAVGSGGTIGKSVDGGVTWTSQNQGWNFTGVSCTSTTLCGAVGNLLGHPGGVELQTYDGSSWSGGGEVKSDLSAISCTGVTAGQFRCFASGYDGGVYFAPFPCCNYNGHSSAGEAGALYAISCPNQSTCLADGDYGTVVATTNGGTGWSQQSPGLFFTYSAISCPSATTCTAVGYGSAIANTTDGGASWQQQSAPYVLLNSISCPTTSTCFAVGNSGPVIHTTDGGAHWSSQTADNLNAVSCPSVNVCFAVNYGHVWSTTNAGALWSDHPLTPTFPFLAGISCPTTSVCFAAGNGVIEATTDAGVTWNSVDSFSGSLNGISCPSTTVCFAVGSAKILATTDGGTIWTDQSGGTTESLAAISCPTTVACYAVAGSGNILATTDGTAWAAQSSGTTNALSGVSCPSATTCLAASTVGGLVIKTVDGGATKWHQVAPYGTTADLKGVSCADLTTCFAVGGQGVLGDTNGSGWLPSFTLPGASLDAISCPSASVCFAVSSTCCAAAPIITTSNGGVTWTPETPVPSPSAGFVGLSCPSTTTCYAVAAAGTFSKTTDGVHWSALTSTGSTTLSGISCTTTSTCFATDAAIPGSVFSTIDGGVSWSLKFNLASDPNAGLSGPFAAIDCPNSNTCYAAGTSGLIATTTDGGVNWRTDYTASDALLTSISCPSAGTCYASARDATILRTTDYGGTWDVQFPAVLSASAAADAGISCPSTTVCVAVGSGGAISSTNSGGAAWSVARPVGTTNSVHGLTCFGSSNCYAAAGDTLMTTHDGGSTWASHVLNTTDQLQSMSCPGPNTCFAVGWPGAIYVTTNGGTTWSYQTSILSGADQVLLGVSCSTTTSCVAVGTGGKVLSTSNGTTWAPETSGTSHTLWAVSCPSTFSCVAVGDYGVSLTRSGGTWALHPSGTGSYLDGVSCPTVNVCYAVGYAGMVRETGNRGLTWSARTSHTTSNLNAIDCVSALMCLAGGDSGAAVVTQNGTGWTALSTPTFNAILTVAFPNQVDAWLGGNGGTILANKNLIPACTSASLTSDKPSPQPGGTTILFTASAGGAACTNPQYQFWMWSSATGWVLKHAYSPTATLSLDTTGMKPGTYTVDVWVEQFGSAAGLHGYETSGLEAWVVGGCDWATLSPNPAPTTGNAHFTATAGGSGCDHPQYQFYLWSAATGWVLKHAFSDTSTLDVNTDLLAAGTYTVDVWVKQKGSPLRYETWALSTIPKGACGSTTITPTQASPQSVGGTVNLNTAVTGCTSPQYEYWLFPGTGGGWQMLSNYSASGSFDWHTAGLKPGTYSLVVHVRKGGTTTGFDTFGLLSYSLTGATSGTLVAAPASPQPLGTLVTLTATAAGTATNYRFLLYPPGGPWTLIQDGPTTSVNWSTDSLPAGTYAWVVYIRQQGSGNAFDSYALLSDSIN